MAIRALPPFHEYLSRLIDSKNLTVADVARRMGKSYGYIHNLTKGHKPTPKPASMEHLVQALECNEEERKQLLDYAMKRAIGENIAKYFPPEAIEPKGFDRVPVLGEAPAGEKSITHDEVERWVSLPREFTKGKRAYLLRVKGDSMMPRINDGDYIIVYADDQPEQGEVVVVRIDHETTIKKFYKYGETIVLEPANPKYERKEYTKANEIHLRGVVKGVLWKGFLK